MNKNKEEELSLIYKRIKTIPEFNKVLFIISKPDIPKQTILFGDYNLTPLDFEQVSTLTLFWAPIVNGRFIFDSASIDTVYNVTIVAEDIKFAKDALRKALDNCGNIFRPNFFQSLLSISKKIQQEIEKQKYIHLINKNLPDMTKEPIFIQNEITMVKQKHVVNEAYKKYFKILQNFMNGLPSLEHPCTIQEEIKKFDFENYDFLASIGTNNLNQLSTRYNFKFNIYKAAGYFYSDLHEILGWKDEMSPNIRLKNTNPTKDNPQEFVDVSCEKFMYYLFKESLIKRNLHVHNYLFNDSVKEIVDLLEPETKKIKDAYEELCLATDTLGQLRIKKKALIKRFKEKYAIQILDEIRKSFDGLEIDLDSF